MMRLVIACWRANITACSAVPRISLTRNCGGLGRAVSSSSVRMRLICTASSLASLMTARAGLFGRQVAADDFNHSGDSRQGIADLVGQPGRQLAQGGEVLGARHLGLMQALDLFAAGLELRHHVVEVAAQIANFVVALGEADGNVHVAQAHARDLVLQLQHGPADRDRQHHDYRDANEERSRGRDGDDDVPLAFSQRQGNQHETAAGRSAARRRSATPLSAPN